MASTDHRRERWQSSARVGLVVFVLAFLVRGAVVCLPTASFADDPDAYRAIATTIAQSGTYGLTDLRGVAKPTAFRPPLYPWLLSWIIVDGELPRRSIGVLHAFLGGASVMFSVLATHRLSGSVISASIAGFFVAADPILLQQSTELMTETLAVAIISGTLWWWFRRDGDADSQNGFLGSPNTFRWSVGLGVWLSLAYLCRPTFLVWAFLVIGGLGMVAIAKKHSMDGQSLWRRGFASATIVALVVGATVFAWTMRNWRFLGHPVWATTHGGYTLLLANNPMFYDYLDGKQAGPNRSDENQARAAKPWDPESFFIAYSHRYDDDPRRQEFWERDWGQWNPSTQPVITQPITEVSDDRLTYEAAKATIVRQPGMFGWSAVARLSRLWAPFPHAAGGRSASLSMGVGVYYLAFYAMVAGGGWCWWNDRRRMGGSLGLSNRWFWLPIGAMVLTLSMVHAVYWSNLRMRAPAIPALAIVAAGLGLASRRTTIPSNETNRSRGRISNVADD